MKFTKATGLLAAAAICLIWFIISFLNASENYGVAYSAIGGIIVGVLSAIGIFTEHKKHKDEDGLISFAIDGFKKEHGDATFQLVLALIISCLPLIAVIGMIIFCASDSSSSSSSGESTSSSGNSSTQSRSSNSSSSSEKTKSVASSIPSTYEEINNAAGKTSNDMKQIPRGVFDEIRQEYAKNPGLSIEEFTEQMEKKHPGAITEETVRAAIQKEISYDDVCSASRSSSNNIKHISNSSDSPCNEYEQFSKVVKEHPGATDSEIAKLTNTNEETARAYRQTVKITIDDVRTASRSTSNNIEQNFEAVGKYSNLIAAIKDNPGASDSKIAQIIGTNEETIRAYRRTL